MVPRQERRISSSGEHYEDSVEVWAREEYDAAKRAQGREPDTDPMAISRYWTHRALDEIKADPAGWLRLVAKKCWLTLWNAEVPNNKSLAFLQGEFLWLRRLPVRWVVLLMLAPAGSGRRPNGEIATRCLSCCFMRALIRRQRRLFHLRPLSVSGLAGSGGSCRRRIDRVPGNNSPSPVSQCAFGRWPAWS